MISVIISRWDQRRVQLLKNIYSISINKMPYDWDQCITEGQKSFDYMIKHFYEMFDDWIHFVNISNWYETPDIEEKKAFVTNKLEELMNI